MAVKEKEKRVYTITEMTLGNAAIVVWILLGAGVCWLFNFFAALGFAALAAFLVFYELGKKGCLSCYYCQTCTIGMGKLPDVFFSKSGTENLNRKARRLFPYVYVLLSVVPLVLVFVSVAQEVLWFKLVLLAAIVLFSAVTGVVRRKLLFTRQA